MEVLAVLAIIVIFGISIAVTFAQGSEAASIAKGKGYDPEAFRALSFDNPRAARLLASTLPDLTSNQHEREIPQLPTSSDKVKKYKKVYIRNFYINIPLRPCSAKIIIGDEDKISHIICVKQYDEIKFDSIGVIVQGYDASENILYNESRTIVELKREEDRFSFVVNIDSDKVEIDTIAYLEVYIEAYASMLNVVKFNELIKCKNIIPVNELSDFKKKNGEDAIVAFAEHDDHWICVCGNKCENGSPCSFCKRNFGETSDSISKFLDNLLQFSNPLEIKNEFMNLKGALSDEKFNEILNYIERYESLKRMYGVNIEDKQRDEIRELLNDM